MSDEAKDTPVADDSQRPWEPGDPLGKLLAELPPSPAPPPEDAVLSAAVERAKQLLAGSDSDCDEGDELDLDDDQVVPVERNIGRELVSVSPNGTEWKAEDRRGERFFHNRHLMALSPVIREIARGRVGMLAKATGVVGDNPDAFIDRTVVASPVLAELIHDGDGAGEVMIAAAAVATNSLAERAVGLLNEELARSDAGRNGRKARDLAQVVATLNKSTDRSAMALHKLRSLRREVMVEVRVHRPMDERDGDGTSPGH